MPSTAGAASCDARSVSVASGGKRAAQAAAPTHGLLGNRRSVPAFRISTFPVSASAFISVHPPQVLPKGRTVTRLRALR